MKLQVELTNRNEQGRPVVETMDVLYRAEGEPVPKHFLTDLFSIPWILQWAIFPPLSPGWEYAIEHDWDCHNNVDRKVRSRRLLRGLLTVPEIPKWKSYVIYWAVLYWPGSEWDIGVDDHRDKPIAVAS